MNSGRLIPVLLILLILTVIGSTAAVVTALDARRFETERMQALLKEIRQDLEQLKSVPPAVRTTAERKAEIANLRFFDPKAVSGGRIIHATSADSKNMNELITNDAFLSQLASLVNDTLGERDREQIELFRPKLAESWEMSPDGLRWKIRLRKGVLWHDFKDPVTGKEWKNVELTSKDFRFYAEVVKHEKTDCAPIRTYLRDLKEIRVLNDYEFEVVWAKKYFLSQELTLSLSPLPRHLYHAYPGPFDPEKFNTDHARNRIMIGVGPYRFSRWEKGRRIVLERWEKYYGNALGIRPPLRSVAFDVIQHPNTRLQALQAGQLDETGLTADQWIHRTKGKAFDPETGSIRLYKRYAMVYNYIGFNLDLPQFGDRETRAAISHLIDRKRIIRDVYFGLARSVTGPFYPDSSANDRTIPEREFSVEKARKMLAGAGWKDSDGDGILERNGIKLKFTVVYPNANTSYQRMLPIIREDMLKAGVRMDLLGLEWSVCVQRLEKKSFEACVMGWSGGITPDPYQLWHSSQADLEGSSNMIHFRNREADSLIGQIRVEFDAGKRTELYHKFHRLIWEESPYVFLFSPCELTALSSRYRNVHEFPLGLEERFFWTPEKLQKTLSR